MPDPQSAVADLKQSVGDLFNADPGVAIVNATANVGSRAQQLMQAATKAAQDAGLDPAFVTRLISAESNWNPLAVSKKGAQGLMQVLPSTAKQYGVSNLMNPSENIRAGISYLKDLTAKYPDRPDLVAAAYNAGPGAVDKSGGVPPYAETKAYVQKVAGQDLEKLWQPVEDTSAWKVVDEAPAAKDKGTVIYSNTPRVGPLAVAGAAKAVPVAQNLLEEFGTNPNVARIGSKVGRFIGGAAPVATAAAEGSPYGVLAGLAVASKTAWAGGKTGWFTAKLAQDIARPISRLIGAASPYASLAFKASAIQNALDFAQAAEPNRKDIGMLGVAIGDKSDPQHPALINAIWDHLKAAVGSETKQP